MPALLAPMPKQRFFTNANLPAWNYKLYSYAAGTTDLLATYSDRAGTIPNANPIILDSRGECVMYLTAGQVYDLKLETPLGVQEWLREDVEADPLATDLASADAGKGASLVRWLSTASGAVARWLHDKIGEQPLTPEDFGAVGNGIANDYAALDLAMTAAAASKSKTLKLTAPVYAFASTLNVPAGLKIVGRGNTSDAFNGYLASVGSRLKWIGADGGGSVAVRYQWHNFCGGGMERVTVDGSDLADTVVEIDGCCGLLFSECSFIASKGVADLKMFSTLSGIGNTATTCSWNTFRNLRLGSVGAGACLHLTGSMVSSNVCHNTFQTLKIDHGGTKTGIILGNCDNNKFDMVYINRNTGGVAYGVYVEPDGDFPIANVFNHLQAGPGGWYQPNTCVSIPATIWDYQLDNGQPYPVLNGTRLNYSTNYGFIPSELPGAPTLLNSWVNSGGGQSDAQYWKDRLGFVHLRGTVKNGSAFPTQIFTLPAGYRPTAQQNFAIDSNGAFGSCSVLANGIVRANNGSLTNFSLDGISFRADYPQS